MFNADIEEIIINADCMSEPLAYLIARAKADNDEYSLHRLTELDVRRVNVRQAALRLEMNQPRPSRFARLFKKK